ncbi:MAG: hypothetical protein IPK00_00990 [Deltaproteobacteria bacterium]|nr:hypothetical protein [Deltaproteobacteria bacterium]
MICTPRGPALEIIRDALRAEVPCIDCSGALAGQAAVPLWHPESPEAAKAPVLALPSSTALAWRPIFEALQTSAGLERVSATILSSAGAWGAEGVATLSSESIALFNQSEPPPIGPAGRAVAFDVVPGGALDLERVKGELRREHGEGIRLALSALQVPTFVGEGAQLALELSRTLALDELARVLEARSELVLSEGASLRDAVGGTSIQVGPIEADTSGEAGRSVRLWLAFDPIRLMADAALRAAGQRLGLR